MLAFNFVGGTGQISKPQPIQSGKNAPTGAPHAAIDRFHPPSDVVRAFLKAISPWCLVTCLLLANHGEVATAEDATSVNRGSHWSQEVWNEALGRRIAAWDCCSRR